MEPASTHSRTLRVIVAFCLGLLAWPGLARAEEYPTRAVRIVVGFPAGGAADATARLIARAMSEQLGQPFVIENRPGAGNNIGTEVVVNAAADGYTLLLVNTANAINATLYENASFNFVRDMAPVAGIVRAPLVLVVNPAVPARTLDELIVYARENPGRINMASAGLGSSPHLAGELLKMKAGIDLTHVPYRGGAPAITDLLADHVQVMFATAATSVEFVRVGKLRALAVTSAARSPALPGVPAVAELVPGYVVSDWYGLGAPKKTPAPIIAKLNAAVQTALGDAKIQARLAELGGVPFHISRSELESFITEETGKWAQVVRFSGATVK